LAAAAKSQLCNILSVNSVGLDRLAWPGGSPEGATGGAGQAAAGDAAGSSAYFTFSILKYGVRANDHSS